MTRVPAQKSERSRTRVRKEHGFQISCIYFAYFYEMCDIHMENHMEAFIEVYSNDWIGESVNSTIFILILKVEGVDAVRDYKLIILGSNSIKVATNLFKMFIEGFLFLAKCYC